MYDSSLVFTNRTNPLTSLFTNLKEYELLESIYHVALHYSLLASSCFIFLFGELLIPSNVAETSGNKIN